MSQQSRAARKQQTAASLKTTKVERNLALLIALLGFVLYANTLGHGYVLDDFSVIKDNKIVQLGSDAIGTIFSTAYREGYWSKPGSLYRPLTLSMFALEWELAPDNPALSHWINVLLYAVDGGLLFLLLARWSPPGRVVFPLIATLLFVAHPLHTEVVANIKSRDEILAFFWVLLALHSLWHFLQSNKQWMGVLSLVCFFLALLSKESVVTFLAVIPVTLMLFRAMPLPRTAQISALYLLPLALYFVLRYQALGSISGGTDVSMIDNLLSGAPDLVSRIATALKILGIYLVKLVFPHPLANDYSFNQIPFSGFGDWRVWASVLTYVGILFIAVRQFRKQRWLSFGLWFFLLTLSLYSNLVFLIGTSFGERLLFLPSLGFVIALTWGLVQVTKADLSLEVRSLKGLFSSQHKVLWGIVVLILLGYSYKTMDRNAAWKDNFTLYSTDVEISSESARMHYYHGLGLMKERGMATDNPQERQRYLQQAVQAFERAVAIHAPYSDAHGQLGLAYYRLRNIPKAVEHYETSLRHNANNAYTWNNLAAVYYEQKRLEDAANAYAKAVQYNPLYTDAWGNLAVIHLSLGRAAQAVEPLQRAIALSPGKAIYHFYLGKALQQLGQPQQAQASLNRAVQLDPSLKGK